MITFNEFLEEKRVSHTITECAQMMVELDVNPEEYIYESLLKIDPVLAESWGRWLGNIGNAVKQFGQNVWSGGGIKGGWKQAKDTVAGPGAKFDAATDALQNLAKALSSPEFKNFQSSSGQGTVGDYVQKILRDLRQDRNHMPQMADAEVQQDYETRGQVKAQRAQNAKANAQDQGQQNQPAPNQYANRAAKGYGAPQDRTPTTSPILNPSTGTNFQKRGGKVVG